jgi:hypothetical protein
MTAQGFFKALKAKIRSAKTLASLAAVRRIKQSQIQSMECSLILVFNVNAMTICKRNDDARARGSSATQSNAFLVGRQSSKLSIETLLLLKAIRMRHKCEALWHCCNSPQKRRCGESVRRQYEQLVRSISAKTEWLRPKRNQDSSDETYETSETLQHVS